MLNQSRFLLEQIIDSTPVAKYVIDNEHRIIFWNEACELLTGVSRAEMIGTTFSWKPFYDYQRPTMADLIVEGDITALKKYYSGKLKDEYPLTDVYVAEDFFPHLGENGSWLSFSARPLKDSDGKIIGAIEILRDFTLEKRSIERALEKENLLKGIIAGSPVPTFVLNKDHKVTHWNAACEAIIGMSAKEMIGTSDQWRPFYKEKRPVLADVVMDDVYSGLSDYYSGIWAASPLVEDGWEAIDYFENFPTGPKWLFFTAAPLYDQKGEICGAIETLQDISNQKEYEERLQYQAHHDALTGLANRTLLTDRLYQAIAHSKREGHLLAVLFLDLDNFKTINDTLGHNVGDQLICESAEKIQQAVRAGDTVARLGGDEFVILLIAPESEEQVADVVERITKSVSTSFHYEGQDILVGASIGIALYPRDGDSVDTLLMNADSAMYLAKQTDKGSFRFFTNDLTDRAMHRLQIENDLHKAIENYEFELAYQPIYNVLNQKIVAAEALIRWRHPEKGMIMPFDFIHIAEETSLINEIGEWVLRTAAKQAKKWQEELNQNIRISINVSGRQFRNNEIHAALQKVLDEIGHPTFTIELELTESLVMNNPEKAGVELRRLKDMGVFLAMDDFGTGYSSLAYLRRFPFDMIKIDKAFVDDLAHNEEARSILQAMLQLGKALGLRMLAEGVETKEQFDFLKAEGCDEIQGYYLSKPVTCSEFIEKLKNNS